MKTALTLGGRIVLLLMAALVVVGITMNLVDTAATPQFPTMPGGSTTQLPSADGTGESVVSGESDAAILHHEFAGADDQSVISRLAFSLVGMLQNVAIIALIVLLVVWIERFFFRQPARMAR